MRDWWTPADLKASFAAPAGWWPSTTASSPSRDSTSTASSPGENIGDPAASYHRPQGLPALPGWQGRPQGAGRFYRRAALLPRLGPGVEGHVSPRADADAARLIPTRRRNTGSTAWYRNIPPSRGVQDPAWRQSLSGPGPNGSRYGDDNPAGRPTSGTCLLPRGREASPARHRHTSSNKGPSMKALLLTCSARPRQPGGGWLQTADTSPARW